MGFLSFLFFQFSLGFVFFFRVAVSGRSLFIRRRTTINTVGRRARGSILESYSSPRRCHRLETRYA